IDVSPLAVEVARRRGLADARLGTLERALREDERFDTILLLGNNLGLLGGERQGRRLLRKLAGIATDSGRILAGSHDPLRGCVGAGAPLPRTQPSARTHGRRRAAPCPLPAVRDPVVRRPLRIA